MFMTTEQIPPPENPEHPALRAARVIRQMHVDTIAKIDGGFVFHKKLENGELEDCNSEMRAACALQIELCDGIIDNMGKLSAMPAALLLPVEIALQNAQAHVEKALSDAAASSEEPLPEIGNYDHKET